MSFSRWQYGNRSGGFELVAGGHGALRIRLHSRTRRTYVASFHADLLLMDDRKGVKIARNKGFRVTGTLGILELTSQARLIDFAEAASLPRLTTFRSPEGLIDAMLRKHGKDGGNF